ncbi:MAG: type II toxin-antitoxin system death-on-curing family toxin [Clostridia bacterium]
MILLTINEIIQIHSKLIAKTGGLDGVRDENLLISAVESANNSFGDVEQYPSVEEKSARLCYAITSNHAFVDGNKRIGVMTMLMTLNLNNIKISYTQLELISIGLSVADGSFKYEQIYNWILTHKLNP